MASRGGNVGWVVTSVILGGLCLTSMIFAFKFYSDANTYAQERDDQSALVGELVSSAERSRVERLKEQLRAAGNRSTPFGYLLARTNTATQLLAGVDEPGFTAAATDFNRVLDDGAREQLRNLQSRFAGLRPDNAKSTVEGLLRVISTMEQEFNRVQAESQRQRQRADLLAGLPATRGATPDIDMVTPLVLAGVLDSVGTDFANRVDTSSGVFASLNNKVDETGARIEQAIQSFRSAERESRRDVERIEDRYRAQLDERANDNNSLTRENLQLKDQIRQITADRRRDTIRPPDETTLVDGLIAEVNANQEIVTINIGRRQKVVLDMQFKVYSDASAISPDAQGNYARPKAIIRVTRVGDGSSTARVIERSGRAQIFAGDVIANEVYDPNKVYKLLVFGDFDVDGDGVATIFEQREVIQRINAWGARVVTFPEHERMARDRQDEILLGDVDFLVLGSRPVLPPEPADDAPDIIVEEWIRQSDRAQLYEVYQQRARETGVPVLTWNRLRTLIGQ